MRTREIERVEQNLNNMVDTLGKMALSATSVKDDHGEDYLLIQAVQWEIAVEGFADMAEKLIKRLRKDDQN